MTRTCTAVLLTLAVAPMAAAQDPGVRTRNPEITLRGCVVPAQGEDQYVLTRVVEVLPTDGSAVPATAHGRKVVFWLDNDDGISKYPNAGVEVHGEVTGFEASEIEFTSGPKDGGLLVEFEGPGKDVVVAESKVDEAIGTSGRESAQDDVQTMLVKVHVKRVTSAVYACLD